MGCSCLDLNATKDLNEDNRPIENNEINVSNELPEEPLIPNFHSHVDASESSIQFNKKIEQDSKKWDNNNPIACVTMKPTMYVKEESQKTGNESKFKNAVQNKANEDENPADISFDNIEIFEKIKTIAEEDDDKENAFLVKSSKTLFEYAYKKVDISDKNSATAQQIMKEVENLKKLNHPNIVKLYKATISSDNKYIEVLTEFPEDGDLQIKLDENKEEDKHFPENLLLDYLSQMCFALQYLHSQNILHRNIKPSSIFLMNIGLSKLGDFGMAKIVSNTGELKRVKTIMPKVECAAPEIFEKKDYSTKTDIWYLGVTFFELMTFNFPFKGKNNEEIMNNILNDNKNEYNYSYSNDFKELINKMIFKDPNQRPSPTDILGMSFIKKRIESYLIENDCKFLKAQDTLQMFDELEEIETVNDNIEKGANEEKDKNYEIKIVDNDEEEDKKEEVNKDEENKDEGKKEDDKKEEEKKEDDKKENDNENKKKGNKGNIIKKNKNLQKTKKEKRVNFNLDDREIHKKNEKNKKKKDKKSAMDFVRQMTFMKELIQKDENNNYV